jgi:hypothetical protein
VGPGERALRLLPQIALGRFERREPQGQRAFAKTVIIRRQFDPRIAEHQKVQAGLRRTAAGGDRHQESQTHHTCQNAK